MKQIKRISMFIILMLFISGCAEGHIDTNEEQSEIPTKPTEDISPVTHIGEDAIESDVISNLLVVYYSWSENTKRVAERLGQTVGADIYEIRTVKAYPTDGYETSDISQEERRTGNLPEIVNDLPDLQGYDTIIIGGPIWNAYVSTPLA